MKTSRAVFLAIILSPSAAAFPKQPRPPVRAVDFSNFKYPGSRGHFPTVEYETEGFTLRRGRSEETPKQYGMRLMEVSYGDVTGDGVEEAIIVLGVETEGSAGVSHVYIYTPESGRPKFLWGFESGDRAWGGLKRVYAEGGGLVVELYGRGTQVGGSLGSTESVGLCCPRSFTRTRYRWQRGSFRQQGEMEILPIPEQSGSR